MENPVNIVRYQPRARKSLKSIFLLILLCSSVSSAQWVSQNYGNKRIRAIQFFNSGNGYLVGENGLLLRLSDWGKSFEAITNLPFQPEFLGDLCFLNQDSGWVVGSDGAVFKTINGGASWVNHDQGLTIFLACHAFTLNPLEYVWVGGLGNIIYCTTRGGAPWQRCDTGLSGSVYDLFFNKARQGYAVTDNGIYSQPPGGAWSRVFPSNTILQGFSPSSENVAWVAGYNGTILRTAALPGGWQSVKPQNFATDLYSIFALSDNEAYAVGANGTVAHTSDVGRHWEISNLGNKFFDEVFALDRDNIWIVGEGGDNFYSEGTVAFGANPIVANERLEINKQREITFVTQFNSTVDLELSTNNGTTWAAIPGATGIAAGLGRFSWPPLPNDLSPTCRLRIRSSKKPQVQAVSPVFEIFQKTLTLQTPRGGESIPGDSRFLIKWTHTNVQNVRLRLQIKQKLDSVKIADNIPASSLEFEWPVPPGIISDECRVRIFETDGSPLAVSNLFAITFDPDAPRVVVDTSQTKPQKGKDLPITAIIIDDSPTLDTLFYRQGGDAKYRNRALAPSGGNQYRTAILAHEGENFAINERGLEFYIKAIDQSPAKNEGFFGTKERPIYLPVKIDTLKHEIRRSDPGDDIYQMVSIPYKLNDASISSVLENDLGPYDPHKWRLWIWRNDDDGYGEFTKVDIGQFTQGRSFWLAAVKDKFFSDVGQSYKPDTVNIELRFGWNQIGHPFAFPVLKQDIFAATKDTAGISAIYGYNDQWQPVSFLELGKGYFIKNSASDRKPKTLKIPPIAKTSAAAALAKPPTQADGWKIKLRAHIARFIDDYNLAGTDKAAAEEWDNLDQPEPPPVVGKYVSLYFPRQEWRSLPDLYTTDFRPPIVDGEIWTFVVATNMLNSTAEINFKWVESVPDEFQVYLLDENLSLTKNLRQNPIYSFPTASKPMRKELKLAVGKPDFFQRHNLQINQVPIDYELAQNFPNPFNPATAIRFGLPVAGAVTLKIFNALGEEIAVLLDNEQKPAGYHVQIWNGLDRGGHAVPSGVYFYRITTGVFTATKKMLFVK